MAIKEVFVRKLGLTSDIHRIYGATEFPCWAHNNPFVHDGASRGAMRRRMKELRNRSAYYFHAHILIDNIMSTKKVVLPL